VTFKAAFTTLNQTRFTFDNDPITITNITVVHIQYFILLPYAKPKAVFVKYSLIWVSCKKYFKLCYNVIIHVLLHEYMNNNWILKHNLKHYVILTWRSYCALIIDYMFIVLYTERPKVYTKTYLSKYLKIKNRYWCILNWSIPRFFFIINSTCQFV
jgi:hypothetical protein